MNKGSQTCKLELKSEFHGLSINYKEETIYWSREDTNVKFFVTKKKNEIVGYLKACSNYIKPENIESGLKKLKDYAESVACNL